VIVAVEVAGVPELILESTGAVVSGATFETVTDTLEVA
jgi:hypothetical protein